MNKLSFLFTALLLAVLIGTGIVFAETVQTGGIAEDEAGTDLMATSDFASWGLPTGQTAVSRKRLTSRRPSRSTPGVPPSQPDSPTPECWRADIGLISQYSAMISSPFRPRTSTKCMSMRLISPGNAFTAAADGRQKNL